MFVKYLNDLFSGPPGWYICSYGLHSQPGGPCLNVLDGSFPTAAEATTYMHNNNETLQQAHIEIEGVTHHITEAFQRAINDRSAS